MSTKVVLKWTIEQTIQASKEAMKLVEPRRRMIEQRVTSGLLDALPNDIVELESLQRGRPAKVTEVKGLTGSEAEIARRGASWISAVREAVRKRAKGTGLERAVGVGVPVNVGRSTSVASAVQAILKAAAENPDGIHACGVLDADIRNGQAILDDLVSARDDQDSGMKDKKDLTTEKNVVQLRVEKAVEEIATAGYIQLMESDPVIAQRFRDLPPSTATKKAKPANGNVPAPAPGPVPLPRKEVSADQKAG